MTAQGAALRCLKPEGKNITVQVFTTNQQSCRWLSVLGTDLLQEKSVNFSAEFSYVGRPTDSKLQHFKQMAAYCLKSYANTLEKQ